MWIAFDLDQNNIILCTTEQEARDKAQGFLEWTRGFAENEGWPNTYKDNVGYAKIIQASREIETANRKNYTNEEWEGMGYDPEWNKVVDYELRPCGD